MVAIVLLLLLPLLRPALRAAIARVGQVQADVLGDPQEFDSASWCAAGSPGRPRGRPRWSRSVFTAQTGRSLLLPPAELHRLDPRRDIVAGLLPHAPHGGGELAGAGLGQDSRSSLSARPWKNAGSRIEHLLPLVSTLKLTLSP